MVAAHERARVEVTKMVEAWGCGAQRAWRSSCEYRFDMDRAGASIRVTYPLCAVPETLRDDVEVAVEGVLEPGPVLMAKSIRVRVSPLPYRETDDWSCDRLRE
jgi:cytochrome c-type biogenesis protein CcmE